MNFLHGLSATVAQHSDRIDDDINSRQSGQPNIRAGIGMKAYLNIARFGGMAHPAQNAQTRRAQSVGEMSANKSRRTANKDFHNRYFLNQENSDFLDARLASAAAWDNSVNRPTACPAENS